MRWIGLIGLAVAMSACGGQPVGSKVPKPDPSHVAAGAALAAGAMTLANPDSAGKRPEGRSDRLPKGAKSSNETVPSDVLDRAEKGDAGEKKPCKKQASAEGADGAKDAKKGIDLIPKPNNEGTVPEREGDCAEPKKPGKPDGGEDAEAVDRESSGAGRDRKP